jgi:hypothetical protein
VRKEKSDATTTSNKSDTNTRVSSMSTEESQRPMKQTDSTPSLDSAATPGYLPRTGVPSVFNNGNGGNSTDPQLGPGSANASIWLPIGLSVAGVIAMICLIVGYKRWQSRRVLNRRSIDLESVQLPPPAVAFNDASIHSETQPKENPRLSGITTISLDDTEISNGCDHHDEFVAANDATDDTVLSDDCTEIVVID